MYHMEVDLITRVKIVSDTSDECAEELQRVKARLVGTISGPSKAFDTRVVSVRTDRIVREEFVTP